MNEFKTVDDRSIAVSDSALVWMAGALALIGSFPALFARGLIGDDWTVQYTYWTEGLGAVTRAMWQVAHGGYSIPMALFVYFGHDTPNVVARIAGLGFHMFNGAMLYAILRRPAQTRPVAALTAALFYLTPFYAIRLTLNAVYDFFLFFYLLSYILMYSPSRWLRWLAPVSLFFSLSLETLIALEPLRLVCIYGMSERWRERIKRLIPFGVAIMAVVVLRFTIMGKSGHYASQYAPVHNLAIIKAAMKQHLHAFPEALYYARDQGLAFLGRRISLAVIIATAAVFAWFGAGRLRTAWPLRSFASAGNTVLLLVLSAAITLLGSLPYAIAGIYGLVTRSESRLLFPAQFGVLLLMATIAQCVPGTRLRAAVAGGAIALFALTTAHDAKWVLYDGLVTSDLQRQTRAAMLASPEPEVVKLQVPSKDAQFFRGRCLAANDMNSAQMLLRDEQKPRSFIYTDTCGDFTNPGIVPHGLCPVSYLDGYPCPAHRETWVYTAAPGIPPLDDIGMVELMSDLYARPSATGGLGQLMKLTDNAQAPLPRAEFKPPCDRPHLHAGLWLLGLPADYCK